MGLGGPHAPEMITDAFQFLAHENYLLFTNSLYNYKFRNTTCIAEGHCEFPEPTRYQISDRYFIFFFLSFQLTGAVLGFLWLGFVYVRGLCDKCAKRAGNSGISPDTDPEPTP
jgi:hypothetical protein